MSSEDVVDDDVVELVVLEVVVEVVVVVVEPVDVVVDVVVDEVVVPPGRVKLPLNAYTFRRNEPPQNSVESPAHVIVQPSVAGAPSLWNSFAQSKLGILGWKDTTMKVNMSIWTYSTPGSTPCRRGGIRQPGTQSCRTRQTQRPVSQFDQEGCGQQCRH